MIGVTEVYFEILFQALSWFRVCLLAVHIRLQSGQGERVYDK